MSDTISRQSAIDALVNGALVNYQAAGHNNGLVKAIDVIKGLPSAQPERKTGRWIDNETSYADDARQTCTCSVCGRRSHRPLGCFCRWCGARMEADT